MRLLPRPATVWKAARRHPLLTTAAAALCLLTGLGVYRFVDQHARAREHQRQAEQAIKEYDFARAQTQLQALLAIQPKSGAAHFLLAQTYRRARREDFDQAEHHLAEAKRLKWPTQAIARESYLLDFQKHGTSDYREELVRQLLDDREVDSRLVLEALVRGCLRADRLEEAGAWLDRWVKSYPDDWYAYLWRATLFQYLDRPARAVADFEQVLRWQPESTEVKQRLGLALVHSGFDYPRALSYLEDHQRSHPDDPDTLVGIARCRRVLHQPEAARALLQPVLATRPEHTDALLARALVELDLDDYAEALASLRRLEPLARSSRNDETFQKLLHLETIATNSSVPTRLQTVYHLLATVLRRLGQNQEAQDYERKLAQLDADVTALRTALEENARSPHDVALWYRLGTLYLRVGMKEDGEYWLLRVLHVNPDDQRAHQALADYYGSRTDAESQQKADRHRRLAGGDK